MRTEARSGVILARRGRRKGRCHKKRHTDSQMGGKHGICNINVRDESVKKRKKISG